jgi:hypothetical protein
LLLEYCVAVQLPTGASVAARRVEQKMTAPMDRIDILVIIPSFKGSFGILTGAERTKHPRQRPGKYNCEFDNQEEDSEND